MSDNITRLFLFLVVGMFFTRCETVPPGPEGSIPIPDGMFLQALIAEGVDADDNGGINRAEAEAIDSLDVGFSGISDLTGIEAFTNLEILICGNNRLSSLDLSKNLLLRRLLCDSNRLMYLNVSANGDLEMLDCEQNHLTALDLSGNGALKTVSCGDNKIPILDISSNTVLESVGITNMPLLTQVCVWITPFPPAGVTVLKEGSPNVFYTTDCI